MNDTTLITALGLSFTFLIILFKQCYKSKCTEFSIFGLNIKRNVIIEEKQHEFDIKNNVKEEENINDFIK